jgi:hypothetical protein
MGFDIRFLSLEQETPFTAGNTKLFVQFEIIGAKPDFVQIYAVNYGETTPAGLADIAASVDVSDAASIYFREIVVQAGAVYTIWLCPRTGSQDEPDDQIDGEYWEGLCVGQTIVTKSDSLPDDQRNAPIITGIDAEPATISNPDQITVTWTSQSYDKFLVWWTKNGEGLAQGEIGGPRSGGSWTASPTVPGARYTFAVKGGTYGGIFGNYNFSDWGPTVKATAPPHYSSLRLFLRASRVLPLPQGLRSLMHAHKQSSVRKFMKL